MGGDLQRATADVTDWHPYAHGAQRASVAWLAVLGVGAAWAWGAGTRGLGWTPPWWLDTPAVFGFYGILYWVFNVYLWQLSLVARLHGIPDLSGQYQVTIRTSHDMHVTQRIGKATIAQSWSSLIVRVELDTSTSRSRGAWLVLSPGVGTTLTYVYDNAPKPTAGQGLNQHEGTAVMTFTSDRRGSGSYYTGRGRTSFGEITFEPAELERPASETSGS